MKEVSFHYLFDKSPSYINSFSQLTSIFSWFLVMSSFIFYSNSTEDEHDVVWFWLEKGKPHECPVCSQYFVVSTGYQLIHS